MKSLLSRLLELEQSIRPGRLDHVVSYFSEEELGEEAEEAKQKAMRDYEKEIGRPLDPEIDNVQLVHAFYVQEDPREGS